MSRGSPVKLSRRLAGLLINKEHKGKERARKRWKERNSEQNIKEKKGSAAVARSEWGMASHLASDTAEAVSVSAAPLIIYHLVPRSNWTNSPHGDPGNGSHVQPRGVNIVVERWGRGQEIITSPPPTVSAIISSKIRGGRDQPENSLLSSSLKQLRVGGRGFRIQWSSNIDASTDSRACSQPFIFNIL